MALEKRKFQVSVMVVPTQLEVQLFGTKPETKIVEIEGYSLADAKRKAGIK